MNNVQKATDSSHIKKKPYSYVVLLLAFFTILELALSFSSDNVPHQADSQSVIRIGLVVLALAKAYLVAAFFMGIKYQARPKVIYGIVFGVPLLITLPVVIIPLLGTLLQMGH
ncbi:MAG: cytochrome C oxidase subunit IV family protein [Candidatus Hodarchaeales archaeon]|jgi:cytochrome c oxidase subunit IV